MHSLIYAMISGAYTIEAIHHPSPTVACLALSYAFLALIGVRPLRNRRETDG